MNKQILFALATLVAAFLHGVPGQAQSPYDRGNTVRIIVGFSPGGSMVAANDIHNAAKPDGLTFGVAAPALHTEQRSGRREARKEGF